VTETTVDVTINQSVGESTVGCLVSV